MAGLKLRRTLAIVTRRTNYGEADRILQLIMPDGQISAIAKGARKQKSKLASGIELFSLSDVVLAETKSNLMRLQSVRLIEPFADIVSDYERLELASRLIRQINRQAQGIGDSIWFELARESLGALNQPKFNLQLVEAWFNLHLSVATGQAINLTIDNHGQPLAADATYTYDQLNNVFIKRPAGEITGEHLKLLRLLTRVKLTKLANLTGIDNYLPTVLAISRNFVEN